jgi:hypothetical protein
MVTNRAGEGVSITVLPKVDPPSFIGNVPHFLDSSNFDAALYDYCQHARKHDGRLKHIGPYHCFHAALKIAPIDLYPRRLS